MTKPIVRDPIYRRRRFDAEIIELCVRWSECGHYLGRNRACPSDSEEAILLRARSLSEFRVAKANLGSSARVALCRGSEKCTDPAMKCPRTSFRASSMHHFRRARLLGARSPRGECAESRDATIDCYANTNQRVK
jgi:hypothetical protein